MNENNNKEKFGIIRITENGCERDINITDFIIGSFKNNRTISFAKTEENTYSISVQNPSSSGRAIFTAMHLTKESLIGVVYTIMLFFELSGEDLTKMLSDAIDSDSINISSSFNIDKR